MTFSRPSVPRQYASTDFRLTLEADWAATLDGLGIKWEYEPTTFTLPSSAVYVPDFHLPELDTWVEVKGPGVPGLEKTREFATTIPGLVLIGHPSQRTTGKRYGTLAWTAVGPQALLGRCAECDRYAWVEISPVMPCRNCGAALPGNRHYEHLAANGEIEFRHAERLERWGY